MNDRYLELEKINNETYLLKRGYQIYLHFKIQLVSRDQRKRPNWILTYGSNLLCSGGDDLKCLDSFDLHFIAHRLCELNRQLEEKVSREEAPTSSNLITKLRCKLKGWFK